jgi:hypothetical protein
MINIEASLTPNLKRKKKPNIWLLWETITLNNLNLLNLEASPTSSIEQSHYICSLNGNNIIYNHQFVAHDSPFKAIIECLFEIWFQEEQQPKVPPRSSPSASFSSPL